jgi:GNAT superfamily N-acetyltransferase
MGRDDGEGKPAIKAAADRANAWLDQHAVDAGKPFDAEDFALVARIDETEAGLLIGILNYRWMYIRLLAIHPDHRRKGLGGGLLERAEKLARALECIGMWLDTYTYQGPDFYPRHGFVECGRIKDYPVGHDRIFFEKRL